MIMTHLAETYNVGSPEYVTALKNIAGGSKQMQGMLDLTGKHLQDFQNNVQNVSNTLDKGQGKVLGWSDVQKDFNFKMDQAKQALNVLFISIGQRLLPVIGNLVSQIAPLIANFSDWLIKSGARDKIVSGLSTTISITVGIISKLVSIISAVVIWFAKVQGPGEILRSIIIGIGAAFVLIQIGAFLATVPALVAGFIAWGSSRWSCRNCHTCGYGTTPTYWCSYRCCSRSHCTCSYPLGCNHGLDYRQSRTDTHQGRVGTFQDG